ncbi:MAG: Na+/H+ antiporter subunit E [Acidilobaceae archaeon]
MLLRVAGSLLLALALTLVFVAVAGDASRLTLAYGALASLVFSALYYRVLVRDDRKLFQPSRYMWLAVFIAVYSVLYESRAHLDLVKRILSPSMPLNPGIVRVSTELSSDYSLLMVASSITNTPGTLTLYADKSRREFYVHWIDVKTLEPRAVRESISLPFERFAKRIFE